MILIAERDLRLSKNDSPNPRTEALIICDRITDFVAGSANGGLGATRGILAELMDAYHRLRERGRQLFDDNPLIACPYFTEPVVLNGEGLHHLRYSAERERSKPEHMLKFRLLPLALEIVRKSGTVQDYRRIWQAIGKPGPDGMRAAKEVEYWGLVAIIGPRPDKIHASGLVTAMTVMG